MGFAAEQLLSLDAKVGRNGATQLAEDGFVILRQVFPRELLGDLADGMAGVLLRQGPHEADELDGLLAEREAADHSLVYQAAVSQGSAAATYRLLGSSPIFEHCAQAMRCRLADVHVQPLYLLTQMPKDQRFDYTWHQDAPFHAWSKELASLWFPVTHRSSAETGTMTILPGTHKQGARQAETYLRDGGFRQIEVVPGKDELARAIVLELDPGDCILFSGHLLHKSMPNRSDSPRVTGVMRVFDQAKQDGYVRDHYYWAK